MPFDNWLIHRSRSSIYSLLSSQAMPSPVRCRAKRGPLKRVYGILHESQGQNLAVTVVPVPYLLESGQSNWVRHKSILLSVRTVVSSANVFDGKRSFTQAAVDDSGRCSATGNEPFTESHYHVLWLAQLHLATPQYILCNSTHTSVATSPQSGIRSPFSGP